MSDSIAKALARWLVGHGLPPAVRRRVRQHYYARLAAGFAPDRWPYSAVVARLVRPGDCVADVGANIGCITKVLSSFVGDSGSVFSFEPVFETFGFLETTVRRLHLRNVRAFRVALSSENRSGTMGVPSYSAGGGNIYESRVVQDGSVAGLERTEPVTLRTLDSLFDESHPPPTFVKIDVEGHELEVVSGAMQVLRRGHPSLLIEVAGDPDAEGSSAHRLIALLASAGYTAYRWEAGRLRPRKVGDEAVDLLFLQDRHVRDLGDVVAG